LTKVRHAVLENDGAIIDRVG